MPKKILIIDDEVDMAKMLKFRLEKNNYEVIVAHDGPEGIEKTRLEKPNLIILDLMLPTINGYDVCAKLKKESTLEAIPIIMLTALAQKSSENLGIEMGASAYIAKPFESGVLLDTIKRLLNQADSSSSP